VAQHVRVDRECHAGAFTDAQGAEFIRSFQAVPQANRQKAPSPYSVDATAQVAAVCRQNISDLGLAI
jgi:hypothetical protein